MSELSFITIKKNFVKSFFIDASKELGGILKLYRPSFRLCVRVFCFRAITLYFMNEFPYNLAEVFDTSIYHVNLQPCVSGL